jgi:PIN domain nuclease of toxin-antitoxin system
VRLLLDTHALLWWFLDDASLSTAARRAIADDANDSFVSAVSAWEIATKCRIGKLPRAAFLAGNFLGMVEAQGFAELPISIRHGQLAGSLPSIHRDPFDRILIAQAIVSDMTLISNEELFGAYGVARLW